MLQSTYFILHSNCYKNFSAVKKPGHESTMPAHRRTALPRSNVSSSVATGSGVFEEICIFCESKEKRSKGGHERVESCETFIAETTIKNAANILNNQSFLAKYGDIQFVAKEVKYHHTCRRAYVCQDER